MRPTMQAQEEFKADRDMLENQVMIQNEGMGEDKDLKKNAKRLEKFMKNNNDDPDFDEDND